MKRTFVLLLAMVIVSNCYCQLVHFLPDSNSYFSVTSYKFWFQGDTMLDSKLYKKVFKQAYDSVPDSKKAVYYAAVREDTLAEKIYCFHNEDSVERLIADFSLNIGDTISVYSFWPFETPVKKRIEVNNSDSVLINNEYRKRLNVSSVDYNYPESWIEGIGSTFGLFYPSAFGFADLGLPELLCVHINDTLVYQNPGYDYCYKDFLVGISSNNTSRIKIYPTITNGIVNIKSENNTYNTHISVFNSQGVKLKEENFSNSINLSFFKTGIYYVVIHVESLVIHTQKIIKL